MAFLRDNNEYIQRLALRPAIRPSQPQLEIPEEILQELDLPENDDMHGIDRRTGDLKVYAYYIRIAGWGVMSIYLFSCMSFVFGVTFPSKMTILRLKHLRIAYNLSPYSCLATNVDQRQCCPS